MILRELKVPRSPLLLLPTLTVQETDLALAPGAIVAALGGWKNPHVAVKDYQRPTIDQQREGMKQWLNRI